MPPKILPKSAAPVRASTVAKPNVKALAAAAGSGLQNAAQTKPAQNATKGPERKLSIQQNGKSPSEGRKPNGNAGDVSIADFPLPAPTKNGQDVPARAGGHRPSTTVAPRRMGTTVGPDLR